MIALMRSTDTCESLLVVGVRTSDHEGICPPYCLHISQFLPEK